MIALRGAAVLPSAVLPDAVVVVDGDRISAVGPASDADAAVRAAARPVGMLLPGLLDVHCHGGAGHSFPDGDPAGAREHLRHGTTGLLASLVTAPLPALHRAIAALTPIAQPPMTQPPEVLHADGTVLGVHLEGPFLSAARCGAQDPTAMRAPDTATTAPLIAAGRVTTMTFAPELPGARELAAQLVDAGVLPAVGHTDADPATTRAALAAISDRRGAPALVTHLFNGMAPFLSREPGAVSACLAAAARGEAVLELIADGVHLADETVRAVFELVGPEHVVLVTDAMAAAGMPDGRYRLGDLDVTVTGGVARSPAGSLAGGTTHLLDVVRRCVQHAGIGLVDAVRAASATPARLLGADGERGGLTVGARADLVCVDDDLRPTAVLAAGRWVDR